MELLVKIHIRTYAYNIHMAQTKLPSTYYYSIITLYSLLQLFRVARARDDKNTVIWPFVKRDSL